MTSPDTSRTASSDPIGLACGLALAAAVSLGLGRFSYALLLPPMRDELHWSYFIAGAMNTANAAGYLAGALAAPRVLARFDARHALAGAGVLIAASLAAHALASGTAALFALRFVTGVASAVLLVGGGLLATRLSRGATHPGRILGLYYGGTGAGIVVSTLLVPPLPWRSAWVGLALAAGAAMLLLAWVLERARRRGHGPSTDAAPRAIAARAPWAPMVPALAGYLLFGVGYIGYMTFIVTLLHDLRVAPPWIVAFYGLLGLAAIGSSWLWAGLLQRARGGGALALLNALLAAATVLPVLSANVAVVAVSCLLFGATFLALVASTTAFVRHNLPDAAWAGGIAAFTIVFAAGQILGPSLIGWMADGPGGLERGFLISGALLLVGAAIAARQAPLATPDSPWLTGLAARRTR
jgi:predicted MFS family arabinose efflux permease